MSTFTHSMDIIKIIDQFKQTMPSEAALEFILILTDLNHDIIYYRYYQGKLTKRSAVTELLNVWCQNLLVAGYDSPEIRICALESEPIIFKLCKKIITDLQIQLLDEFEYILLVIVQEMLYHNPRDFLSIYYFLYGAKDYLDKNLDDKRATSLSRNLIEIHKEITALENHIYGKDDDYDEMVDTFNNYSNPDYEDAFYVRHYSEQELKNEIFKIESETFPRNDKIIEHLIAIMAQNVAKLTHPAFKVMEQSAVGTARHFYNNFI